MIENTIKIRPATTDDAPEILAIYGPYIENTAISFEYEVPTEDAFRRRMAGIMEKFPYLAAVDCTSGKIVGYAYANTFRERKAYNRSVELSIYLKPEAKGRGIGRRLYDGLAQILKLQNYLTMIACITDAAEKDDPHNTNDSINFHTAMGFEMCGSINKCGYKFGKWYNTIYMEKYLGEHGPEPLSLKTFEQIREQVEFNKL